MDETIIAKARKTKDPPWSQDQLAFFLRVQQPTIAQWETRKTRPSYENILKLSALLDIEVKDIIADYAKKNGGKK